MNLIRIPLVCLLRGLGEGLGAARGLGGTGEGVWNFGFFDFFDLFSFLFSFIFFVCAGFFLQFPFKFADLAYSDAWPKDLGTPGAWVGAIWNFECFELVDLFDFLIFKIFRG